MLVLFGIGWYGLIRFGTFWSGLVQVGMVLYDSAHLSYSFSYIKPEIYTGLKICWARNNC